MAEEFKYTLTFDSKATGTGAKDTAAAIERLTVSHKQLTASTGNVASFLDRTTDSTKAGYGAFYDLDAAMGKTARTSDTFTAGATQVNRSTRDASRSLLLFSQGFEDAQYGIRGVLNNIPGLVIALGGTAGIAGAISIAAVSFSVLFEWLSKTEEKSSDVADRIDAITNAIGEVEADKFREVADEIDLAAESAEALKTQYSETQKSEQAYAISALDNAAKIKLANDLIASALGLQVDKQKELIAIAEAEATKRKLLAEQAAANEIERLAKANEEVTKQADLLSAAKLKNDLATENLVILRGQLAALREQREELEKTAQERATDDPGLQVLGAVFPKAIPTTKAADQAQQTLDSEAFRVQLAAAQERVERVERLLETLNNTVPRAENGLIAAQQKALDIQSSVETNLQKIQETFAADELLARSQELVKTGEQSAADIKAAFTDVQTSTAAGAAARTALLAAAADGKITADEVRGVSANLQTLTGQLQAGLAGTSGNVQDLIGVVRSLQRTVEKQSQQIKSLQSTAP